MLEIVVLGAGAGGGFPQWNSNADACRRARAGDPLALPCTQTSLAVSGNGADWYILNAAPDLRAQIERTPELHPGRDLRSTPIAGVVLTGGEVDTIAGLLSMRERQAFLLLATKPVHACLDANPIFEALDRSVVRRVVMALDRTIPLTDEHGAACGLSVTPFAVPGKVPLYLEDRSGEPGASVQDGETIGLAVSDGTRRMVFVPGCAFVSPQLRRRIDGADCMFFDATLWHDAEMIDAGLGSKSGRRMGHMSVSGADGVMETFEGLRVGRKILIHINNSNPLLLADSAERATAERRGWMIAHDAMRLSL